MKKILVLLALLLLSYKFFASVGCIDNSYHTKQSPDYKTFNYVQCDCKCNKNEILSDRIKCSTCNHYHGQDFSARETNTNFVPTNFNVLFNSKKMLEAYNQNIF